MRPLCLINVVGLTPNHLGPAAPKLSALAAKGMSTPMRGILPAVTCSAQATLLTGKLPTEHGIVGNGWFQRDSSEVRFWMQSNRLIQSQTLYAEARRRAAERGETFTCAKLFWWFNQGAPVDWSVTPKPHYGADGSKAFDVQSTPAELAGELTAKLGAFPFPSFWGPMAGLPCSEWIASAAVETLRRHRPTLTLVYLPHLDYDLQRFGPDDPRTTARLGEVDSCAGRVIEAAEAMGATTVVVSEYGLMPVNRAIAINRILRQAGWLAVRDGPFGEMLDTFGSRAFAVADHQIAHIYVSSPEHVEAVADKVRSIPGVARVCVGPQRADIGLDHERAGDIVALSERDSWFAYPYWLDDRRAPDFARTVDIHRKPGYDPCELFFDPERRLPMLRVIRKLAARKLGFRNLIDVTPLDPSLVRGSHGVEPASPADGPVLIASDANFAPRDVAMTDVMDLSLRALGLGD